MTARRTNTVTGHRVVTDQLSLAGLNVFPAYGDDWYVDNTPAGPGSDRNAGSPAAPFDSIGRAIQAASAGDRIHIVPGTVYDENVIVAAPGISIMNTEQVGNAKRVAIGPTTGIALDVQAGALRFDAYGLRLVGTSGVGCKLGADGARFEACDFTSDTTHGLAFVGRAAEASDTGSGSTFVECLFRECGASGINQGLTTGKTFFATNVNLVRCQFYLNTDADIIDEQEAGGQSYWFEWHIDNCYFMTSGKSRYLTMDGGASECTMLTGCYFNHDNLTSATHIKVASGIRLVGCYDLAGIVALGA